MSRLQILKHHGATSKPSTGLTLTNVETKSQTAGLVFASGDGLTLGHLQRLKTPSDHDYFHTTLFRNIDHTFHKQWRRHPVSLLQ